MIPEPRNTADAYSQNNVMKERIRRLELENKLLRALLEEKDNTEEIVICTACDGTGVYMRDTESSTMCLVCNGVGDIK